MLRALLAPYLALPRRAHLLCLGVFVNRAGTFVMPFMAIYLSQARGFDEKFVTLVIGVYGAGGVVASVVGGALADRIGRKPVMVGAMFGGALVLLLLSTITSKIGFLLAIGAFALVMDLFRPASSAMLSELVEPQDRTRAFAFYYVAINFGFAVGALAGGFIAKLSFEWLFYADAATSIAFAALIAIALPETLPNKGKTVTKEEAERASNKEAFLHMLRNRTFVALCASNFIASIVFHQAESTLPLYMTKLGMTPDRYGQVMAVNGVLIVALQLPAAQILSGYSRGAILALGPFLVGVGFGSTGLLNTPLLIAGSVAIWTAGEICMATFHSPVITDLAPEQFRARYFGVATGMFGAAMMIGPPAGGWVMAALGTKTLWVLCFLVASFAAALLLPFRRRLDARA